MDTEICHVTQQRLQLRNMNHKRYSLCTYRDPVIFCVTGDLTNDSKYTMQIINDTHVVNNVNLWYFVTGLCTYCDPVIFCVTWYWPSGSGLYLLLWVLCIRLFVCIYAPIYVLILLNNKRLKYLNRIWNMSNIDLDFHAYIHLPNTKVESCCVISTLVSCI